TPGRGRRAAPRRWRCRRRRRRRAPGRGGGRGAPRPPRGRRRRRCPPPPSSRDRSPPRRGGRGAAPDCWVCWSCGTQPGGERDPGLQHFGEPGIGGAMRTLLIPMAALAMAGLGCSQKAPAEAPVAAAPAEVVKIDHVLESIDGGQVDLAEYRGKAL